MVSAVWVGFSKVPRQFTKKLCWANFGLTGLFLGPDS